MKQVMNSGSHEIEWEISVPLLNNRLMVGALVKVLGLSVLLLGGLLSLIFASQNNWDLIPQMFLMMALVGAGLILLGLVVMGVIFGNRMRCRYSVSDEGIRFEAIDKTLRATNRLAVIVGLLLGRPQAVGAGLIGQSQEIQNMNWRGNFRAQYEPDAHVVTLRNGWRRLMIIYCTAENYAEVAARVQAYLVRYGTEERVPRKSPLPRYLGYSVAIILASVPVFWLHEPFDVPLWMPLILLCFALATVWLISLFGYVVLGSILLVIGALLLSAFSTRKSYLHRGETYPHWSVFSGDDWALLALACVGLAVLGWFALQAVRGRINSMFAADVSDMEG